MENSGINISGGNVRIGNAAVGTGARAIQHIQKAGEALDRKGLQEIRQRLDALVEAIGKHAAEPKQKEELLDSTRTVAEELTKPKPNRLTIMGTLGMIAGTMKSAAGIATAAEAVKAAVLALL
jgi:hypothetical protein